MKIIFSVQLFVTGLKINNAKQVRIHRYREALEHAYWFINESALRMSSLQLNNNRLQPAVEKL